MTKGQSSECDIIMKGGITSGVVYPKTILRMAEQYRFRSIGGTSAGAIAAALTAAAEYNRAGGGFSIIEALPEELQTKLLTLFQPAPQFRSLFTCALLFAGGRRLAGIFRLLTGTWPYLLAPFVVGLTLAAASVFFGNYLAALLLALIGLAIAIGVWILAIAKSTLRDLNGSDFGFCPGPTQPGEIDSGLSDWLSEKIEIAAGRMQDGRRPKTPLTFGDIWVGRDGNGSGEQRSVDLRMMTTNLSLRRPNALPDMDRNHYFKEDEFRRLFPEWVVEYLKSAATQDTPADLLALGFYALPIGGAMPVIVAARMSLSFPILFSAVPLYRRDFPHQMEGEPPVLQRMLFSDGGLSSNFPVHFFDALLPNRPTFGISLDAFDERDPNRRVYLPMKAAGGIWLDSITIDGLAGFLMSLINAAKDWQDRLQSILPGYRERIASIYLTDDEGGLNLNMTSEKVTDLVSYGDRAGALTTGTRLQSVDQQPFDFEDHRWRRFLVAFARLEETLQQSATSWYDSADPTKDFIATYLDEPSSYSASPLEWRLAVVERFDEIMAVAQKWNGTALRDVDPRYIPKPKTTMRITPIS